MKNGGDLDGLNVEKVEEEEGVMTVRKNTIEIRAEKTGVEKKIEST